jgi:hypothetical protein
VNALAKNTTGSANVASGFNALGQNTTALDNTASGAWALGNNIAGSINIASGYNAMRLNTSGYGNSAFGVSALYNNNGPYNIAVGLNAGFNLTTGTQNIDIGNRGVAAESNTIRIGTQGTQKGTYIAGISGAAVTGVDVTVNSSGRLGIAPSSARFKRDIHDMGESTSSLMRLRPVTFRYKSDPQAGLQYGLVAEEVERVYPELVTYGSDGKVEAVRYSMLAPMLLNELQKRIRENRRQASRIRELTEQVASEHTMTAREIAELSRRQAEQIKRLYAEVEQEKADREREIMALRNTLGEHPAILERAAAKTDYHKMAGGAFER